LPERASIDLSTVGGVRELLLGEHDTRLKRTMPIAIEDPHGLIRPFRGLDGREVNGTMTFVITLGAPLLDGATRHRD
jgi:hypothetical protein